MTAMRFLNLITDPGDEPTPTLVRLVKTSERKEVLSEVIQAKYEPLFNEIDVTRATLGQLEQAFGRLYKVEGDTRRKAITFFLHATQFAGIPLSTFITNKTKAPRTVAKPNGRAPVRRSRPAPQATQAINETPELDRSNSERHGKRDVEDSGTTERWNTDG